MSEKSDKMMPFVSVCELAETMCKLKMHGYLIKIGPCQSGNFFLNKYFFFMSRIGGFSQSARRTATARKSPRSPAAKAKRPRAASTESA